MSCLFVRSLLTVLQAPDGGLPGIPGSGGSGSSGGGLPGIPGDGPSGLPGSGSDGSVGGTTPGGGGTPAPPVGPPVFLNPEPGPGGDSGGTFELSGWWRRVGALLIDIVLLCVVFVPLLIGSFALADVHLSEGDSSNSSGILVFLLVLFLWLVAWLLYAPIAMAIMNGATLGKKALGIRVMRADGQPMTFGSAAVREIAVKWLLFGIISNLTIGLAYLLDVLWPLWDSEHRALHDMVAKTRVVRA